MKKTSIILFLIILQVFSAQELDWKPLKDGFFLAAIEINSHVPVKDKDSIYMDLFRLPIDENVMDHLHHPMSQMKLTSEKIFSNIKQYIKDPIKKDSKYALKQEIIPDYLAFEIFLDGDISTEEIDDLLTFLENHFGSESVKYINKIQAVENAKQQQGSQNATIDENMILPSVVITLPSSKENKIKMKNVLLEMESRPYIHDIKNFEFNGRQLVMMIYT